MKFEAEMDEKYGSPTAALTDLTQKMNMADDPTEKGKLKGQIDSMFKLYTQLEKAQADATGSEFKSPFSKESLTNIFANTEKAYTKPYFEVDLETGIEKAMDGTQAQMMQAKADAYTEIRNRFTTKDADDNDIIDPQINRMLGDRVTRVAREATAYKNTELSKFQNQDATAKFVEVATKEEANDNMMAGKYKPGTVVSYKEDGVAKMVIWTGTGAL
jgi:hypothetical protein